MTLNRLMKEQNISAYRLSKDSNVPYMTINDLVNKKTLITKCNAETVYRIAKALNSTVEELLESYTLPRCSFELFKSNVCHKLKELGDLNFLKDLFENNEIEYYYNLEWYPECLYLLAMADYISRINNIPLVGDYRIIRNMKLDNPVYPSSVLAIDLASSSNKAKKDAWNNSIPEFRRFNIIESEVRNVA